MKPLGINLRDGAYSMPGPATLLKCLTKGPDGGQVSIWLSAVPKDPPRWEKFIAVSLGAENGSLFNKVEQLLNGVTFFFEGNLQYIADFLEEVYRILFGTGMSEEEIWSYFCNCSIAMNREKLVNIKVRKASFGYWPWRLRPIVRESYNTTTYLPAYLVCLLYRDIFGAINFSEWIKSRFVPGKMNVPIPPIGNFLTVEREVFVPDPVILDLFGSAYYAPDSPLPDDIRDAVVAEPCTGTGVLAVILIQLGARKVISTDIHEGSVRCAKENIQRLEMSDRIHVEHISGMPQDVKPDLIIANPPWYGGEGQHKVTPAYYKRCLEDPGHTLLRNLLRQSRDCTSHGIPFYVFLGADDPFTKSDSLVTESIDCETFDWTLNNCWIGDRDLRLYRLLRN